MFVLVTHTLSQKCTNIQSSSESLGIVRKQHFNVLTSELMLSLSTAYFLSLDPQQDLTFTTNYLKLSIKFQNLETTMCHRSMFVTEQTTKTAS